ncbi:cation diffusion facilitator family transporter [Myxococcota bacterium]|nr:cation diffusion facilitator family transporter [Myxococcota bacterium]
MSPSLSLPPPPSPTHRQVRRILWSILGLNVAVAAAKLAYGFASGAVAIQADGVHSLLDGSANVVALVALRFAAAPPDPEHPYGHRRFEAAGAAVVGMLILAGAGAIAREAWQGIFHGREPEVGAGGIALVMAVAALNLGISTWEARAGKRLGSALLTADAAHTRSDFLASLIALVAAVGIAAGQPWIDVPAAVVVLGLVVHTGLGVLGREVGVLVDRAAVEAGAVERIALAEPGVRGCHKVRSRGHAHAAFVDLHVQVDPGMTIAEAHDVAGRVKARIRAAMPEVVDVLIHVEPYEGNG